MWLENPLQEFCPGLGLNIVNWPPQRVIYPDVHVAALPQKTMREPGPGWDTGATLMEPAVELASPLPEQAPQLSVRDPRRGPEPAGDVDRDPFAGQ